MLKNNSKGAFIPLILLGVGVGALFLFQANAVTQPNNGARAIIGDAIVHRPE